LKKAEAKKFFEDMERNILRKMQYGDLDMKEESSPRASEYGDVGDGSWEGRSRRMSIGGGVRLVRTISSVDGMPEKQFLSFSLL
jgi:hypothetical protein